MSETLPYEVLKPIAFKGDRIEKGSIIHLTQEEAENIGEEYVKPAEQADEQDIPSDPSDPDEQEDDEPTDPKEPDADDSEKKEGDESSSTENKTDDTQTDNKPEENI
ncbi:MAG: hypothetical protein V4473_00785 [Patescibacteria group bacterium]